MLGGFWSSNSQSCLFLFHFSRFLHVFSLHACVQFKFTCKILQGERFWFRWLQCQCSALLLRRLGLDFRFQDVRVLLYCTGLYIVLVTKSKQCMCSKAWLRNEWCYESTRRVRIKCTVQAMCKLHVCCPTFSFHCLGVLRAQSFVMLTVAKVTVWYNVENRCAASREGVQPCSSFQIVASHLISFNGSATLQMMHVVLSWRSW